MDSGGVADASGRRTLGDCSQRARRPASKSYVVYCTISDPDAALWGGASSIGRTERGVRRPNRTSYIIRFQTRTLHYEDFPNRVSRQVLRAKKKGASGRRPIGSPMAISTSSPCRRSAVPFCMGTFFVVRYQARTTHSGYSYHRGTRGASYSVQIVYRSLYDFIPGRHALGDTLWAAPTGWRRHILVHTSHYALLSNSNKGSNTPPANYKNDFRQTQS